MTRSTAATTRAPPINAPIAILAMAPVDRAPPPLVAGGADWVEVADGTDNTVKDGRPEVGVVTVSVTELGMPDDDEVVDGSAEVRRIGFTKIFGKNV